MPGGNWVGLDKGFISNSTLATEFLAVVQASATNCALPGAAGALPLGVAQESCSAEDVTNERHINVRCMGSTFAVASAAIALNARVAVVTTGKVATATIGQSLLGVARTVATAADQLVIVHMCIGPVAP